MVSADSFKIADIFEWYIQLFENGRRKKRRERERKKKKKEREGESMTIIQSIRIRKQSIVYFDRIGFLGSV